MATKTTKQRIDVLNGPNVLNGFNTNVYLNGKFHLILNPKQIKSLERKEDWLVVSIRSKPQIKVAISADDETLEKLMCEIPIR